MPPFRKQRHDTSEWISSDALPRIGKQKLERAEAQEFLEFVFRDVAHKPAGIGLREGASVARYLRALAREGPPGPLRVELDRMARLIWLDILEYALFQIAKQHQVVAFVQRHARTHLNGFNADAILQHIKASGGPTKFIKPTPLPRLMSRSISAQGHGQRLQDDLSERVLATYHALRTARVYGSSTKIAQVLNAAGINRSNTSGQTRTWTADDVRERVKQQERCLVRKGKVGQRSILSRFMDKWVYLFRTNQKPPVEASVR